MLPSNFDSCDYKWITNHQLVNITEMVFTIAELLFNESSDWNDPGTIIL